MRRKSRTLRIKCNPVVWCCFTLLLGGWSILNVFYDNKFALFGSFKYVWKACSLLILQLTSRGHMMPPASHSAGCHEVTVPDHRCVFSCFFTCCSVWLASFRCCGFAFIRTVKMMSWKWEKKCGTACMQLRRRTDLWTLILLSLLVTEFYLPHNQFSNVTNNSRFLLMQQTRCRWKLNEWNRSHRWTCVLQGACGAAAALWTSWSGWLVSSK